MGHPFKAASVPRIEWCNRNLLRLVGVNDVHQEQQDTNTECERTNRCNAVPESKVKESFASASFGPHHHSARLALQTKNVHRSEREVHSDHHQPKVPFTNGVVELTAEHFGPPVIEAREQSEYCSTEQHVMEVRHDVVGISLLRVCWGHGVGNARETANGELNNQRNREHHRNGEGELSAPHRHDPVHDLHTSRNSNSHRRH